MRTLVKFNRKCIRKTGFTLKQWAFMLGIAAFITLWFTGNLPSNYDHILSNM